MWWWHHHVNSPRLRARNYIEGILSCSLCQNDTYSYNRKQNPWQNKKAIYTFVYKLISIMSLSLHRDYPQLHLHPPAVLTCWVAALLHAHCACVCAGATCAQHPGWLELLAFRPSMSMQDRRRSVESTRCCASDAEQQTCPSMHLRSGDASRRLAARSNHPFRTAPCRLPCTGRGLALWASGWGRGAAAGAILCIAWRCDWRTHIRFTSWHVLT